MYCCSLEAQRTHSHSISDQSPLPVQKIMVWEVLSTVPTLESTPELHQVLHTCIYKCMGVPDSSISNCYSFSNLIIGDTLPVYAPYRRHVLQLHNFRVSSNRIISHFTATEKSNALIMIHCIQINTACSSNSF